MTNFVLIAEDNPSDQAIIKAMVEQHGFIPICANDGYEAIDLIDEFRFKLFIIDLQMPVMNGLQLLKRVKNRKDLKDIPAIVLSGRKEEVDVMTAIKCGAKDYILKPLIIQVFNKKILPTLQSIQEPWQEYYMNEERHETSADVLQKINLRSLNERDATIVSPTPFPPGQEVEFTCPFFSDGGLDKITCRVSKCTPCDDGTENFTVTLRYHNLNTKSRRKLHQIFEGNWFGESEKAAMMKKSG